MRARRKKWAAVLLAGATGLSGVGSVLWFTALPAAAFTAPVKIVGRAFDPQTTRIEVGDKVLWRNLTDERHTVTSDSGSTRFDYTLGRKNAQEERRFETAGTYTYHCKFHPEMTGTVEVVDPSAPTTTPSTVPPTTASTVPPTTASTVPPTTASTAPPTTTTTAPPAPTTAPPTTTTTAGRPSAAVPLPPVPNSAAAPPPAPSSTTTMPPSSTTTVPPTTATSAPPPDAGEAAPPTSDPTTPPPTEAAPDTGDEIPTVAGPASSAAGDKLDPATVTLISLLVAVGLFGAWTLIRIRPGRI